MFGPDRLTPDGMAESISQRLGRPAARTTGFRTWFRDVLKPAVDAAAS
ncbi:hypothetical protein ABTZ93_15320 [Streptomyces sp. NPDC097941]